ncbi:MAG: hypothetical protein ACM32O_07200 [Clostridia bacterium]
MSVTGVVGSVDPVRRKVRINEVDGTWTYAPKPQPSPCVLHNGGVRDGHDAVMTGRTVVHVYRGGEAYEIEYDGSRGATETVGAEEITEELYRTI